VNGQLAAAEKLTRGVDHEGSHSAARCSSEMVTRQDVEDDVQVPIEPFPLHPVINIVRARPDDA
jgi:hypothetical protein